MALSDPIRSNYRFLVHWTFRHERKSARVDLEDPGTRELLLALLGFTRVVVQSQHGYHPIVGFHRPDPRAGEQPLLGPAEPPGRW